MATSLQWPSLYDSCLKLLYNYTTSLQRPLSSVSKVAIEERFNHNILTEYILNFDLTLYMYTRAVTNSRGLGRHFPWLL